MKYRQLIKSLKGGVLEQLLVINAPLNNKKKTKDEKKLSIAHKVGILGIQKMILDVHKYSVLDGVNNSRWIIESINSLINGSASSMEYLLDVIESPRPELDTDDEIKDFYDLKTRATEDYIDISNALDELNEILESTDEDGNITLKDRGEFKASFVEDNADKPSKAGYREDIDAIAICPNGTIGEIVNVYGLRVALPKKPSKKHFHNEDVRKKADQHWVRKEMPKGLILDTAGAFKKYIDEEHRKKHEGTWFMNNGEPTYITGSHYFLLQWGKTDAEEDGIHGKGFFHYREAHRDLFYFMEAVWVDSRALGMIYVKTRRTGATYCMIAFMLCKAISLSDSNFGLTSKSDKDAEKIFAGMLVHMFANLPFFMKPIRTSDTPKKILEFREPQRRITKTNKNQHQEYEALNSEISFRATTEDAYDQYALRAYIGDEFSKWKKPHCTLNHWRMISRAFTKGKKIRGKALLLSTVEKVTGLDDPYDKDAESGDKYKYLCDNADVNVRNKNGRTKNGLYRLFIPCYDNFEGFIDVYGKAVKNKPEQPIMGVDGEWITNGILEFLEEEAAALETPEEVYNFWRLNPRNLEEAFRVASEDSIFPLENLSTQVAHNDNTEDNYIQGNFEWKGGNPPSPSNIFEAEVEFVPSKKGRFRISWMPDNQYRNMKIIKGNLVYPANGHSGSLGSDPYRASETVNRKGSNGSTHGCTSPGCIIGPPDKMFLEYCYRPEDVKTYTWDVIKACVFYGMPVLMENSVTDALRYMEVWGFRGYSMNRPDKPLRDLTKHEMELGGYPASTDTIDRLTNVTVWYANTYVGIEGHYDKMLFNNTINDWIKYKKQNRTKHDMTVSSSLAIFASRTHQFKHLKTNKKKRTVSFIKRYKIRGHNSVQS